MHVFINAPRIILLLLRQEGNPGTGSVKYVYWVDRNTQNEITQKGFFGLTGITKNGKTKNGKTQKQLKLQLESHRIKRIRMD
jgi:hypothetical protein